MPLNTPTEYAVEISANPETGQFTGPYNVQVGAEIRIVLRGPSGMDSYSVSSDGASVRYEKLVGVTELTGGRPLIGSARTDAVLAAVSPGEATVTIQVENVGAGPQDTIVVQIQVTPGFDG